MFSNIKHRLSLTTNYCAILINGFWFTHIPIHISGKDYILNYSETVPLSRSCHHKSYITTWLHIDNASQAGAAATKQCVPNLPIMMDCIVQSARLWAKLRQAMSVSDQRNRLCNRYNFTTITKERSHFIWRYECGRFVALFLVLWKGLIESGASSL